MGCLLWVQRWYVFFSQSLQWCIQYDIWGHIIVYSNWTDIFTKQFILLIFCLCFLFQVRMEAARWAPTQQAPLTDRCFHLWWMTFIMCPIWLRFHYSYNIGKRVAIAGYTGHNLCLVYPSSTWFYWYLCQIWPWRRFIFYYYGGWYQNLLKFFYDILHP